MGHDRGPAPDRALVLEQDPGSPSPAPPQREEELPSSAAEAESRQPERPATTETPAELEEAQEPRQPSTPAGPPRRHSSELLTSARPPQDPPLPPRQAPRKQQQEPRPLSTQLQASARPLAPQQLQEPPRRSIPKTVKPAVPQRERRTQTQTQSPPLKLPPLIHQLAPQSTKGQSSLPQAKSVTRLASHQQQATTQLPPAYRRLSRSTAYLRRMRLPTRIQLPCRRHLSLPNSKAPRGWR